MNGAHRLQKELRNQVWDRQLLGRSWGNLSPVGSVISSEFQWDKVRERKKEICLFGVENHFKRKKN